MRRRIAILLVLAAVALLLTLGARTVDLPRSQARMPRRVPDVVWSGRDEGRAAASAAHTDLALVSCTVEGERAIGSLTARDEAGETATSVENDRTLTLALEPGTWSITWKSGAREVPLGDLDLASGDTQTCNLKTRWDIAGTVRNPAGEPVADAAVEGCNAVARTGADGRYTLRPRSSDCAIVAYWQDGLLSRPSEQLTFTAFDEAQSYDFVVDDSPVAGMGIRVRPVSEGIAVASVYPDTPAWNAGLREEDVLVRIDGVETAGMSAEEFVRHGLGSPNSVVNLVVSNDEGSRRVQFRRERISGVEDDAPVLAMPEEELRERLEEEITAE